MKQLILYSKKMSDFSDFPKQKITTPIFTDSSDNWYRASWTHGASILQKIKTEKK